MTGFEGLYEVSNLGNVRSLDRTVPSRFGSMQRKRGRPMRPYTTRHGYPAVNLKDRGRARNVCVHRLVAESFIGPCPDGYEVAHNDGTRTNPRADNLRYDTRKGNHADKLTHGTWQGGENNPAAKLHALQVKAACALSDAGWSNAGIGELFGVSLSEIRLIVTGQKWSHVTGRNKNAK